MRLRRLWQSWTGFWFTPADPTPLCLMRIVAGLLTIYVHVAYTFDLQAFFGPHGWYDQQEANRNRKGTPYLTPATTWQDGPYGFHLPANEKQKRVVCQFIERVVSDAEPERLIVFMNSINFASPEDRDRVLAWFLLPPEVRAEHLAAYQQEVMPPELAAKLPEYFSLQKDRLSRQNFATALQTFNTVLPTWEPATDAGAAERQRWVTKFVAPKGELEARRDLITQLMEPQANCTDRERLIALLLDTNAADWEMLFDFIHRVRAVPAAERKEFIEYYADWGVRLTHVWSRGMPIYSPWFHVTDPRWLLTIHLGHIFVMVLFTIGMYTRVMAVATWLAALSYVNRAQPYLFGQDTMMILSLAYLMLSPCGAKWSVDRWMLRQRARQAGQLLPPVEPSVAAGFAIRVLQVQYCLMYLSAGLAKLKGEAWWNGTALYACLANPEFSPLQVGLYRDFLKAFCTNKIVWELGMAGTVIFTLFTEIGFPFLVWTKMRYVMVGLALVMHMGIAILMGLSVFSLFMFSLLLAFFPPEAINWMFESKSGQ